MKWRIVLLVVAMFITLNTCFVPNIANASDIAQPADLVSVLDEIGIRYDCYFTIEEGWTNQDYAVLSQQIVTLHFAQMGFQDLRTKKAGISLAQNTVTANTLEETMKLLQKQLDAEIIYDNNASHIFHIVDKKLRKLKRYSLREKVKNFSYKGLLTYLPSELAKLGFAFSETIGGGDIGVDNMLPEDTGTVLNINLASVGIRSLLTRYPPLTKYHRVLWIARTKIEDEPTTTIKFRGLRSSAKAVAHKIFQSNEIAYEEAIAERGYIVIAAIEFLSKANWSQDDSQVRWAMRLIGDFAGIEGMAVLLDHIDYYYTDHSFLEECYPAVYALRKIGKSAAEACLERLSQERNLLRRKLLCSVLILCASREEATRLLQARNASETNAEKKFGLDQALRCFEETEIFMMDTIRKKGSSD
ncbi:MAG: hypothetical protein V1899_06280 [Planctomycetota bacterium]